MSLRRNTTLTPAKLAAQRANARRSTGPRTAAGKARSRWNALRHGGWAGGWAWSEEALRAIGEDPEEFQKLRESLLAAHGPADDPLWNSQMEELARLYWRRSRLERAWYMLISREKTAHVHVAAIVSVSSDGLPLMKQLEAADRSIDRKIRLLMRLRESAERHRAARHTGTWPEEPDPQLPSPGDPSQIPPEDFGEKRHLPAASWAAEPAEELIPANSNLQERSQNVDENKRAGYA